MATQTFCEPLTQCATFLVVSATARPNSIATIKQSLASVGDIVKNVSARYPEARLSCNIGIGSTLWDQLHSPPPAPPASSSARPASASTSAAGSGRGSDSPQGAAPRPRPRELRKFSEVRGAVHTAVSTPGDILFHIRAERRDVAFEFERQLLQGLDEAVTVEDSTSGFRYFDGRDLLGFVDGTANPAGADAIESVVISAHEDAAAAGGCYIVVQKYLHDVTAWAALSTEQQERIVGRTKLDNVELDDASAESQKAHKTLATIVDDAGQEHDILRDNMPFGSPGQKTFGTYFIGYAKNLWVVEKMLENMFVGCPPGKHDKILDYSRAVTGVTFYAPPPSVLEDLAD